MIAIVRLPETDLYFRMTCTYAPGVPAITDGPPENCTTGEDETIDISCIAYMTPEQGWADITLLVQSEHCVDLANILQDMLLTVCRGH